MPVLMLHGAGGGAWEWNVWRRVFDTAAHRVVAPDLLPCDAGLACTSFDHYVAQAVLGASALAPPRVLVGASLGGLLALAAAAQVETAALVLVNPMPPAPEAARLPPREPALAVVPWSRDATLAGTRRALPDADAATTMFAFRRWRDESGAVLDTARAGIALAPPRCPVLVIASDADDDVPDAVSAALATRFGASLLRVPGSHVGPLLGRDAARNAAGAVSWLNSVIQFRAD